MRRRVEYDGAVYHVIQRGNNREAIFRDDADYYRYLSIMAKVKAKYNFLLLGYALMGNHYHLLIRTGETPLQTIIFDQNMLYSRYYNKRHDRTGHLYGSRYKALLIQDEKYLFSVLRYIHWNPCRAGRCEKPEEYAWSSDSYYRHDSRGIVDTEWIFKILNPDRQAAVREYTRLIKHDEDINYESGKVIGVTNAMAVNNEPGKELLDAAEKVAAERPSLDQILIDTGVSAGDFNFIKAGSRKRGFSAYKCQYTAKALQHGYTLTEIGANINISAAAVSKKYAAY